VSTHGGLLWEQILFSAVSKFFRSICDLWFFKYSINSGFEDLAWRQQKVYWFVFNIILFWKWCLKQFQL